MVTKNEFQNCFRDGQVGWNECFQGIIEHVSVTAEIFKKQIFITFLIKVHTMKSIHNPKPLLEIANVDTEKNGCLITE